MKTRWLLVKNAVANLGKGGAASIVAFFLPPLLVRHMAAAEYGVWVLVLQVAAYVSYLDLGLQTAVGRYVAHTTERNDFQQRNSIFSTAFAGLSLAAVAGLILLVAAAAAIQSVFPTIPPASVSMMRWALLILGGSLAIGLPASAWNGVFVGLQRNEIPALVIGGGRLLSAVGVVVAAFAGKSVVVMAAIMAVANIVSYVVQYAAMRKIVPDIKFELDLVKHSTVSELLPYCFGLTVMSFSMLLVTGFDLILVGRFQFSAVTPYSVAASIVTFISGVLYSALNAMMPHAAAMHARQAPKELGRLVIVSTQIAIILLIFTGIPVLIYAAPILQVWIGQRYVQTGYPLLITLVVANIVRLIGAPYATILISAGQQRLIKVSPLTEGISNLLASLVLGSMMGAIGVALGTLVGSVFSIGAHLVYSMPRTSAEIQISRRDYVLSGVVLPFLATAPLLIAAAWSISRTPIAANRPLLLLAAAVLSVPGSFFLLKHSGVLRAASVHAAPNS